MLTLLDEDGKMSELSQRRWEAYFPPYYGIGGFMAESAKKVSFELDAIERSWVHVSLQAKREQLVRSRNKEVTGSEIWVLRGKEIEALNALMPKFV